MSRWDTDGGDEEGGAGVDYYGNQVIEFAFCVVVAMSMRKGGVSAGLGRGGGLG